MYEHSCAKAGAEGCGFTVRAASEEELKAKVGSTLARSTTSRS